MMEQGMKQKSKTFAFEVSGKFALFSEILTRVGGEKTSYPIPTYEALKGIAKSIYWKPVILWYIDAVRVMNPIRFCTKGTRTIQYAPIEKSRGNVGRSYYTYLEDVRYKVLAHFEWNLNQEGGAADRNWQKHEAIMERAIKGGGRRDIFLGVRECQGYVEPCSGFLSEKGAYDNSGIINYGWMEYGFTYPDEAVLESDKGKLTFRLWSPVMENGIIRFPDIRSENAPFATRVIREGQDYKHFAFRQTEEGRVEHGVGTGIM